ncbi:uncharacterized protein LOC110990400 [Acanthaster planci]|uniref:Uncharacterized protein LOC110990400 n=1 Tax=Acanthaster planci TaxID=133434 RepID=A0A8B8A283_ACAPL|nr:uncharacterized protein LOC110990400 [Acanthaster planci]
MSAVLFWSPKLGPITLILDKESKADHKMAARLRKHEQELGFKFDIIFEPLPNDTTILRSFRGRGYGRQLWSSFFMDLYVNASVIGWTDTDVLFTTPVTPENIFNGRRLRVLSFTRDKAALDRAHQLQWYESTKDAIGKEMVADFMSYFPAYVWRDTITNCRNHIMKHMMVSQFEDVFRKLYPISPVNIIMNYAYHFEHNRYDWHLDFNESLEAHNSELLPDVNVTVNDTFPDVHVAIHTNRSDALLQGYCVAKRYVGRQPTSCERFAESINFLMFEFTPAKSHMKTWCSPDKGRNDCIRRIEAHYQNFRKYYDAGWYDLDLGRVTALERAAKLEHVTCPHLRNFD